MVPKHVRPEAGPAGDGYRAPDDYYGAAAGPGAAAVPEGGPWQEWPDGQAWGPPPALHPDHPSAPMPAIQFPADAARYQGQAGPSRGRTTYFRRDIGPFEPGPGPDGWWLDGRPPGTDPLWVAGQLLRLADGQAAQIKQGARDDAAAIREAAQREAAAIRQAAEREAAELRARLDAISSQMGRVAAYVTESLASPSPPATAPVTAPALPGPEPALPGTGTAAPDTSPVTPGPSPGRPGTRPARKGNRPVNQGTSQARRGAAPDTRPARTDRPARPGPVPRPAPAQNPQKRPRQLQAIRIATYATAAMLLFVIVSGATEIGIHGFKFFTFREGGTGETKSNETDHQFLVRQSAAAHHATAPKGRHHKKSQHSAKAHSK